MSAVMRLAFVGEALIDFTAVNGLTFQGREGGALANSVIAAARLGQPAGFITQLSTDLFGERLLTHLQTNGVDTRFVTRSADASALAFVERAGEVNRYAFYIERTAGTWWAPSEIPALPDACRWLYFGSIALLYAPAGPHIETLVAEARRAQRVCVFDPNVRPSLIADVDTYRTQAARWISACHLLKLSDEDLAVLSPGLSPADAAATYLANGPCAVVVTHGAAGASLHRAGHAPLHITPPPVVVADTVGAGDTFGAALSVALLEAGVERPQQLADLPTAAWLEAMTFAATAAALNCANEGADPPHRAALDASLRASGAGANLA